MAKPLMLGAFSITIASELRWQIVEQIHSHDKYNTIRNLLHREAYWIDKLETLSTHDMNELRNLAVFL